MERPALPRWFWLLPLLAIAAWWPIAPSWQSDDFFALHYVQDVRNVLHDFVGPQYAASDVWAFWRPLITASLWLEQFVGGPAPFVSHLSNVLAHGVSALLVACVWRRFLPPGSAFAAGLVWALLPSHQGSIAWAVGRVDSHTTVWCLLAALLALRAYEAVAAGDRARRWPLAAATAAALLSKELALVVPALAAFVVWLRAAGSWRERTRASLTTTWPAWLVLLVYVPLRLLVLGRFGGYDAAGERPPLDAYAAGLAKVLADLLVPLRWSGTPPAGLVPTRVWIVAAAVPAAIALLTAGLRQPRLLLAAAAAFLLALAPVASFLPAADNPQTLRLYYLPTVALCGVLAVGGRLAVAALLLAVAWPFVAMRSDQLAADRESVAMHRALLREANDGAESPLFVAGLPHANRSGTVVQLHFGVDRLLQAPFTDQPRQLYALRPLSSSPAAFRLVPDDDAPFPLPGGSTWCFAGATALVRAHQVPPLARLAITGDAGGVVDLTTPRLDALTPSAGPRPVLHTTAVRPPVFRVTVFTGSGYIATVFFDHAPSDAADGAIDLRRWLAGDDEVKKRDVLRGEPARFGVGLYDYVGEILDIPTVMDRSLDFPVLVEGGAVDPTTFAFTPTHRADRMLTFRFDRGFTDWKLRVQGKR